MHVVLTIIVDTRLKTAQCQVKFVEITSYPLQCLLEPLQDHGAQMRSTMMVVDSRVSCSS